MTRRLALLLLPVVLLASACTGKGAVDQSVAKGLGYQPGDAALTWVAPKDRATVSGVRGRLLDGSAFDLDDLRGHVVVVNFWGSWCRPCEAEMPALEQVHRDTAVHGVDFVGVDVRDDVPSAESFLRAHHVTYPSVFDPSNLLALHFHGLPPSATPSTIVLDREGRIAVRHSGAILYTQLRAVVQKVVAES